MTSLSLSLCQFHLGKACDIGWWNIRIFSWLRLTARSQAIVVNTVDISSTNERSDLTEICNTGVKTELTLHKGTSCQGTRCYNDIIWLVTSAHTSQSQKDDYGNLEPQIVMIENHRANNMPTSSVSFITNTRPYMLNRWNTFGSIIISKAVRQGPISGSWSLRYPSNDPIRPNLDHPPWKRSFAFNPLYVYANLLDGWWTVCHFRVSSGIN